MKIFLLGLVVVFLQYVAMFIQREYMRVTLPAQ